jgi:hypothetical protein
MEDAAEVEAEEAAEILAEEEVELLHYGVFGIDGGLTASGCGVLIA